MLTRKNCTALSPTIHSRSHFQHSYMRGSIREKRKATEKKKWNVGTKLVNGGDRIKRNNWKKTENSHTHARWTNWRKSLNAAHGLLSFWSDVNTQSLCCFAFFHAFVILRNTFCTSSAFWGIHFLFNEHKTLKNVADEDINPNLK